MKHLSYDQLSPDLQQAIQQARDYSACQYPKNAENHGVGAVLISGQETFYGAGIKRRRFNSSTCAERHAIDSALISGVSRIDRIVLYAQNDKYPFEKVVSPCGSCRQIIYEAMVNLGQTDIELVLANQDLSRIIITSISELLPLVYSASTRQETSAA